MCLCELTTALDELTPCVTRQLARLEHDKLLASECNGEWTYYHPHPATPDWIVAVLDTLSCQSPVPVSQDEKRLLEVLQRRKEMGLIYC